MSDAERREINGAVAAVAIALAVLCLLMRG